MNMSNIDFEIAALLRFLADNPVVLLHFLAYACAITLIIAIVRDAFLLRKQTDRSGKILENRPKTRSELMLRPLPGLEMANAGRRPLPHDEKQSKF